VNPPAEVEDDMAKVIGAEMWRIVGFANVFLYENGGVTHLNEELFKRYLAAGVPGVLVDDHPEGTKSILSKAGLMHADLVPAPGASVETF
jgi:hypothetical protein